MPDSQTDPKKYRNIYDHFQESDKKLLVAIQIYLCLLILASTICLFPNIGEKIIGFLFGTDSSSQLFIFNKVFFSVFCGGVLGSTLFGLRRMYSKLAKPVSIDNSDLSDNFRIKLWLATFVYKPFVGGALAIMVLSMLNAGFLSLSDSVMKEMNIQAIYFQISFGFLVGFGSNEVIKKVDEIIAFTFSTAASSAKTKKNQGQPVTPDNSKNTPVDPPNISV